MIFGIDICNTIADVNEVLMRRLGPNPNPENYHHPKVDRMFFKSELDVFSVAKPIKGSRDFLNSLVKENQIFYITARPLEAKERTITWLMKHKYPCFDRLIFTNDKLSICNDLNVDFMIEDSPFELDRLYGQIKTYVYAQPYNTRYPNRFYYKGGGICFIKYMILLINPNK
ncbi:5' nucleotidase, NT5C type [Vallitalea guaymasensis]|uniref:5' nucleotidase, NT5C type n=1 Tax=Vallitalea guaymasensis TaxID=1185412 RepID=UPI000DE4E1BF|nr:hypothetical protein [Vallitalea guaymasensis]